MLPLEGGFLFYLSRRVGLSMADENLFAKKDAAFKEDTNMLKMSILMHCRTVVEKQDYVSTGILTYVEGDMIEIEIGDYWLFELGDLVKVTIYTPSGIFIFNTTVIAKDEGSLIMINPPENRKKFVEKREHTRIEIEKSGQIKGIGTSDGSIIQPLREPLQVAATSISLKGIGFTIKEGDLKLSKDDQLEIVVDLEFKLACTIKVMRIEGKLLSVYYGAEILDIPSGQVMALRGFILRAQVEMHSKRKNIEVKKRFFK
jgi:c-di-GMP-binding flagellar brake protein YcgR